MKTILQLFLFCLFALFCLSAAAQKDNTIRYVPLNKQQITLKANTQLAKVDPKVLKKLQVYRPNLTYVVPGRNGSTSGNKPNSDSEAPKPTAAEMEKANLARQREGASGKQTLELVDNVSIDASVSEVAKHVLSYDSRVSRDINIKSGYYYYAPDDYHLGWSAETGRYDFQITYLEADGSGPGKVVVTAALWPKLNGQDVSIMRDLLKQEIRGKAEEQYGVTELTPLNSSEQFSVNLPALSQFGVTDVDMDLIAPTSIDEPVIIMFTTTNINSLQNFFFGNQGLKGDVVISCEDGSVTVPFTLKIDDPATFGKFDLKATDWRKGWRNTTDYPLILGHLHALRKERNGRYRVYSWKAGGEEVPPGASVDFNGTRVPGWIDTDRSVKRVWMDYTVKSCKTCDAAVKKRIFGGGRPEDIAVPEKLEFTILTPMKFTEAELMRIRVRSTQASASSDELTELDPISVDEDGEFLDGGTLYVRGGQVRFDYQIVIYLEDGSKYSSDWITSTQREVVIGSSQIRRFMPEFDR